MQLTNFLQLINDLDPETRFYFKIAGHTYPLAKFTLSSQECLAVTGNRALTRQQMGPLLVNLHHKNTPLRVQANQKSVAVYGLQFNLQAHTATLR